MWCDMGDICMSCDHAYPPACKRDRWVDVLWHATHTPLRARKRGLSLRESIRALSLSLSLTFSRCSLSLSPVALSHSTSYCRARSHPTYYYTSRCISNLIIGTPGGGFHCGCFNLKSGRKRIQPNARWGMSQHIHTHISFVHKQGYLWHGVTFWVVRSQKPGGTDSNEAQGTKSMWNLVHGASMESAPPGFSDWTTKKENHPGEAGGVPLQ